mgnify:CR=1 FL=1
MATIDTQIVDKFGQKANQPEIIKKCLEMIDLFGLTPEELFLKWETFIVTTSIGGKDFPLTLENLEKLQLYIQKRIVRDNQKTPASDHIKQPIIRGTPDISMSSMVMPSTPLSLSHKRRKLGTPQMRSDGSDSSFFSARSTPSPIPSSDYGSTPSGAERSRNTQESGSVLETLNSNVVAESKLAASEETQGRKLRLIANFDPAKYKFRTMNQKLLEVADYLDDQIDRAAQIVLKHYKFDQADFGNPNIQSQAEILAVGRIVPDSPTTEYDADLNSHSLFLEASRLGGIGERVRLDLAALEDYSLFPGQIVCLRGINPTGAVFKVTKQYTIPYLGAPVMSLDDQKSYQEQLGGEDALMKVVVTAGPYTASKKLDFGLLSSFVDRMNADVKPNTIIMFGPFLDVNHKQIEEGTLDFPGVEPQPKTLDEVFKFVVAPILRRLKCTQVILIPSTRDAISDHAAYPQRMYERKRLGLSKAFKCFPNPATFSLNEVLVGCSNNDVFRDLKDVNRGSFLQQSRFNRVADHILEQRRYYPSFPGGIKCKRSRILSADSSNRYISGADLHVSYMGLAEFPDSLPDILLLPSELKHFAKVVKNVLVVNPGNFVKLNRNGSYALLSIKAPVEADLEKVGGDTFLNNIWKRARVDIYRV